MKKIITKAFTFCNNISNNRSRKLYILLLFILPAISCDSNDATPQDNGNAPVGKFSFSVVLKLPSGYNNPRNSEGDFIGLNDGRIMYVYSKYVGTSSGTDHDEAFLAARYSSDKGVSWTNTDRQIVERESGGLNVMSVSLLRLQNGNIALFYLLKNSTTDCKPMMRISTDEGETWGSAIPCITDKAGYFVLNNDRVIQLKDERLMLAVALHQVPGGTWSDIGKLYAYYSDDNGLTWTASEQVPNEGNVAHQEPGLIELNNGDVRMFSRTNASVQYYSLSKDRGKTWTPSEPSNIVSANWSPASITRNPYTGDQLLVWNHNDSSDPLTKYRRTPLNLALSRDDGNTWIYEQVLEDRGGSFCYTAVHYAEDFILLGYMDMDMKGSTIIRIDKGLIFR